MYVKILLYINSDDVFFIFSIQNKKNKKILAVSNLHFYRRVLYYKTRKVKSLALFVKRSAFLRTNKLGKAKLEVWKT